MDICRGLIVVSRCYRVLRQVGDCRLQEFWIIPEAAKPEVAIRAQEFSHFAGGVVMVESEDVLLACPWVDGTFYGPADRTGPLLSRVHGVVFLNCDLVSLASAFFARFVSLWGVVISAASRFLTLLARRVALVRTIRTLERPDLLHVEGIEWLELVTDSAGFTGRGVGGITEKIGHGDSLVRRPDRCGASHFPIAAQPR